jgi:hypothetical protein
MQRILKKISNEIADLNKNSGEGSSTRSYFKPPFKKNFPLKNKTSPPIEGINVEDFVNIFKDISS